MTRFHTGRGSQLESCHHGTRLHRDHFDFDAEIFELELNKPRHRLERLSRVSRLACWRVVEQLQRRQLARLGREHRNLALFLNALALLRLWRRRLDAGLGLVGGFLDLNFEALLTSRLTLFTLGHHGLLLTTRAQPIDRSPETAAGAIDDGQPRNARGQREPSHCTSKQQQRATDEVEIAAHPLADQTTDDTACTLAQLTGREVQCRQRAGRREQQGKAASADEAVDARDRLVLIVALARTATEDDPAGTRQHQRKQECGAAEEKEQRIGKPGALQTDEVVDVARTLTREGEARIRRIVGHERRQQHERDRAHQDDHDLAQTTFDAFGETGGFCTLRSSIGQWVIPWRTSVWNP